MSTKNKLAALAREAEEMASHLNHAADVEMLELRKKVEALYAAHAVGDRQEALTDVMLTIHAVSSGIDSALEHALHLKHDLARLVEPAASEEAEAAE